MSFFSKPINQQYNVINTFFFIKCFSIKRPTLFNMSSLKMKILSGLISRIIIPLPQLKINLIKETDLTYYIQHLRNVSRSSAIGFQLKKNDVLLLDNELIQHGRYVYV